LFHNVFATHDPNLMVIAPYTIDDCAEVYLLKQRFVAGQAIVYLVAEGGDLVAGHHD
jgi:hypothetical protein